MEDEISKIFLHSCLKRTHDGEVVVVRSSNINKKTLEITPELSFYKNPRRSFYITKPEYRNHKFKKERERIEKLDKYECYNYELAYHIKKVLGIYSNQTYIDDLCKSSYIYGADIKIEALIKMNFINTYGLDFLKLQNGFLDIETSVIDKSILIITYSHGNKIYTAIRKSYMYYEDDKKNMIPFTIDDIKKDVYNDKEFKEYNKTNDFVCEFYASDSEIDLLKYIFSKIFKNKTDFIGIWNMNFDIPRIISRIKAANLDPASIMCHPEVPEEYRYLRYNTDKSKVDHFTLKWHWLYCTGYTQFVDSMGLFSQCRKTAKFRNKYTLDAILKEEGVGNKRSLGVEQSHFVMQTKRFNEYILYNIIGDVIGLELLEKKNMDITSMIILSGVTPVNMFAYKQISITNKFYDALKRDGYIISSKSNKDPLRFIL